MPSTGIPILQIVTVNNLIGHSLTEKRKCACVVWRDSRKLSCFPSNCSTAVRSPSPHIYPVSRGICLVDSAPDFRVARGARRFPSPPPPPDAHSAFVVRHNRRRGPDARITATMADDFAFNEGFDFDVSDDERSGPPQAAWDFSGARSDFPLHLRRLRFSADATRPPRAPLRDARRRRANRSLNLIEPALRHTRRRQA